MPGVTASEVDTVMKEAAEEEERLKKEAEEEEKRKAEEKKEEEKEKPVEKPVEKKVEKMEKKPTLRKRRKEKKVTLKEPVAAQETVQPVAPKEEKSQTMYMVAILLAVILFVGSYVGYKKLLKNCTVC